MGFPQALSETRAIQAEVPTKLVGNLSQSFCWKAFPQPLSEGYTIHNLVPSNDDSEQQPVVVAVLIKMEGERIFYLFTIVLSISNFLLL